jgi:hypothetical protein
MLFTASKNDTDFGPTKFSHKVSLDWACTPYAIHLAFSVIAAACFSSLVLHKDSWIFS